MKEKLLSDKRNIFIIIFGIIAIVLVIYQLISNNDKKNDYEIVTSSSKFYTVSNCVDRYLNYLSSEDVDNLLILIDNSYKKKYNVNKNNFFDKVDKLDSIYSFVAKKMYQEKINKNITKYYVKGYLLKEDLNVSNEKIDYYLVVLLDTKNSTYSIIPYDGEIFNKEDINEK